MKFWNLPKIINSSKWTVMIFNRSRKFYFLPNIKFNRQTEEIVESFKLLGVVISSDLKWHEHISQISKRENSNLWLLCVDSWQDNEYYKVREN